MNYFQYFKLSIFTIFKYLKIQFITFLYNKYFDLILYFFIEASISYSYGLQWPIWNSSSSLMISTIIKLVYFIQHSYLILDFIFSGLHWEIIVNFAKKYDYIPSNIGRNWISWVLWFSFGINIMLCHTSC